MENEEHETKQKSDIWGKAGLAVALVALFLAFLPSIVKTISPPPPPPPPAEEVLVDIAKNMINKFKSNHSTAKQPSPPPQKQGFVREAVFRYSLHGSLSLAALAFGLSMISFVRHENKRLMQSTVAVSAVVVGYNFFWIAIATVIILVVFVTVAEYLDFT